MSPCAGHSRSMLSERPADALGVGPQLPEMETRVGIPDLLQKRKRCLYHTLRRFLPQSPARLENSSLITPNAPGLQLKRK